MAHPETNGVADRVERSFFGKYRGVVADNKDPEKLGRLKIRMQGLLCGETTDWAWPCLPFGGNAEQGLFLVPEVGARVWVEFEEGNLDVPIWVGVYWAKPGGQSQVPTEAQDMAGTTDDLEPKRRVLKTSSGHLLELSDVPGKETIRLSHKDGAMIFLDEKGSVTINNKEGTLLFLNAADKEVTLADEHGNFLAYGSKGVTLQNKDGSFINLAGDSIQLSAKNVHLRSQTVSLGESAFEPAILGVSFAGIFDAHTHAHPMGPTGPPIPVPMPMSVSTNPAVSKCVTVK